MRVFEAIARAIPDIVILTAQPPPPGLSAEWKQITRRRQWGLNFTDLPALSGGDVLISGLDLLNISTWRLLLRHRDQFVLWGHGFGRTRFSFVGSWLRIFAAWRAKASLFYTEGGREQFRRYVPGERLFVARNTIDLPATTHVNTKPPDSFLFFGDLRAEKGVDVLIDAFGLLAPSIRGGCRLAVVGDGPAKRALVAQARRSPLANRISFHPRTSTPEELKAYLDGAIATVSPLHVGLSVVQSFWAGVPIVTQRNKGHAPEFEYCVPGENSIVYEGGVEALAEAMASLMDPRLRERLSSNAKRYYQQYLHVENMVDGFVRAVRYVRDAN